MMRGAKGTTVVVAVAGWLVASAGCTGGSTSRRTTTGRSATWDGFFFVGGTSLPTEHDGGDWYGCSGPMDVQRVRRLAVDATVQVGLSAGGCVRAEEPDVAASPDCGVVRGVASGATRLVVTSGDEILDHTDLHVDGPTGIDVRTPWGDLLETLVSIGFDEPLDTVVVLTAGQDLMGVGRFTLASEPPDCVHADGYGRYFRLTALCTGRINVTCHAVGFDASDVLRLEVREPTRPLDGGSTGLDAGGADADATGGDVPDDVDDDVDTGADAVGEDGELDVPGEADADADDDVDVATDDAAVEEADAGGVD